MRVPRLAGRLRVSPLRALRSGREDGFLVRALLLLLVGGTAVAQGAYVVPANDARVLRGVDFGAAQVVDPALTALYGACDANTGHGGCADDPAHNTAILKFADGTVFFDAKMAIDADGSTLSKLAVRPNQPETSFRFADPAAEGGVGPSLDAERVPYVVMPLGDFRRETGVQVGDLAAVVHGGQVRFAVIGDLGPRTHIGEASMALHMAFGRHICTAYDAGGNCSAFTDTSIDAPVLYFFFPDTKRLIADGLTPANINERIQTAGKQVWTAFLARQRESQGGK